MTWGCAVTRTPRISKPTKGSYSMTRVIIDNFATIIVAAIIAVLAIAAVRKIRKDRKAGIHSCGGNCSGCAMGQMCAGESAPDKGCRTTGEQLSKED